MSTKYLSLLRSNEGQNKVHIGHWSCYFLIVRVIPAPSEKKNQMLKSGLPLSPPPTFHTPVKFLAYPRTLQCAWRLLSLHEQGDAGQFRSAFSCGGFLQVDVAKLFISAHTDRPVEVVCLGR